MAMHGVRMTQADLGNGQAYIGMGCALSEPRTNEFTSSKQALEKREIE